MKKILFVSVVFVLLPVFSFAHGGMMSMGEFQTGPEMMEYVEDSVMGNDLHEEMEQLMIKMMSGAMTQDEVKKITELMGQYPGPYGMMMNRLGSSQANQLGSYGWNMMSGWGGIVGLSGLLLLIFVLNWLIWTVAGILFLVWLFKKVFSGK